jgi:hypothetical protein
MFRPMTICTHIWGGVMIEIDGLWVDENLEYLIDRLELRLEQYRLHADALSHGSRDREGADALVLRLEERLTGLRSFRDQQRPPH